MDDLPAVLGADGCPGGGWVVAEVAQQGPGVVWHHVVGMADLLSLAAGRVLAVDVPIGLPESGSRPCDVEARRRLRPAGRSSSVFAAPVRSVLDHGTYAAARAGHASLSAQSFALVSRIRDVDEALRRAGPHVHDRVVECHPELVFAQLLAPEQHVAKKTAPGALARVRALEAVFGPLPVGAPVAAGLDDALDALACAWTARRWARGQAEVLGTGTDATGAPMRIVV